jgi:hypothetical protein
MNSELSDKYSTHRAVPASLPSLGHMCGAGWLVVQVEGASLLGARVTAYGRLSTAEHERRMRAGLGAVVDPALLDRLMDLPAAVPIADAVVWAEMSNQPSSVVERGEDGATVVRMLRSPLIVDDVVLTAAPGRELRTVQDASLFARFTRRWITVRRDSVPDSVVLEARLCGVGILDCRGSVLLAGETPATQTLDGWVWLLQEKAYRRWLSQRPQAHVRASRSPAIGAANGTLAS